MDAFPRGQEKKRERKNIAFATARKRYKILPEAVGEGEKIAEPLPYELSTLVPLYAQMAADTIRRNFWFTNLPPTRAFVSQPHRIRSLWL